MIGFITRLPIKCLIAIPGYARSAVHNIYLRCGISAVGARCRGVLKDRVIEGIVEYGVRNEATRIIRLSRRRVSLNWIAGAVTDGVVVYRRTLELVRLERLDIPSMVLVEIREAVVKEDRRVHILGDVESQSALRSIVQNGCYKVARIVGICDILSHP